MDVKRWDPNEGAPTEKELRRRMEALGYSVTRWVYDPGTSFDPHTHSVDKIDAIVSGRFRVSMGADEVVLGPGDWAVIPRGTRHSAEVVGDDTVVALDGVKRD